MTITLLNAESLLLNLLDHVKVCPMCHGIKRRNVTSTVMNGSSGITTFTENAVCPTCQGLGNVLDATGFIPTIKRVLGE